MSTSHPQPPYHLHPSVTSRVDPEYATFYNAHIKDKQQTHLQPLSAARNPTVHIPGAGPPQPVGATQDFTIPRFESSGPDIRVRAFTPVGEAPAGGWPACIWYHGGGWALGNLDADEVIVTHLCSRANCVVIVVEYRLAPEEPFPAAVEDCWEAFLWTVGAGASALGIDTSRLAVSGSSAGANLAAVICQRAVSRNTPFSFKIQLLCVPVLDNTAVPGKPESYTSWTENEFAPALPAPKMLWYRRHYLPDEKDWANPEASPMLWEGDWAKLPPVVMLLGGLDVLKSEGEQFADKLRNVGVRADVHVMKGQPHPFIALDAVLEAGREAIRLFCEALVEAL